ncbi:MAG: protoporphyrinogen oxidase [Actinomycetota bacterium]
MRAAGRPSRVTIVGGGISGLAAAHRLLTLAAEAGEPIDVTVREREQALGGKIRTTPFAGLPAVDEGADAFLARVPWAVALAREVGLGDQMVSPATGSAAVWWNGLQPIPAGLLLGMPTDLLRLARTRLISWPGKLRAATEMLRPRTPIDHGPGADSIGAYVRARFGDEVHERLVDPLVGSIYAADTDRFSLTAVAQIHDLAATHRSVLLAARRRPPAPEGPVFFAPAHGMGQFVAAIAQAVHSLGGTIRCNDPVGSVTLDGPGWRVDDEHADAVVLAGPAAASADLLATALPEVAAGLAAVEYADVVMVTIAIPAHTWPDRLQSLSGYLVPKPAQRLVTAVSFGSQKWAHWRTPDMVVLRISLGRDGLPVLHLSDEQLVEAALRDTGEHLGLVLEPTAVRLTRWAGAFPQYRPGHAARVAGLERALPAGLALAGASHHGIGIPACVHSGQRAAAATLDSVANRRQ